MIRADRVETNARLSAEPIFVLLIWSVDRAKRILILLFMFGRTGDRLALINILSPLAGPGCGAAAFPLN